MIEARKVPAHSHAPFIDRGHRLWTPSNLLTLLPHRRAPFIAYRRRHWQRKPSHSSNFSIWDFAGNRQSCPVHPSVGANLLVDIPFLLLPVVLAEGSRFELFDRPKERPLYVGMVLVVCSVPIPSHL